jgi:hypothetical protein
MTWTVEDWQPWVSLVCVYLGLFGALRAFGAAAKWLGAR